MSKVKKDLNPLEPTSVEESPKVLEPASVEVDKLRGLTQMEAYNNSTKVSNYDGFVTIINKHGLPIKISTTAYQQMIKLEPNIKIYEQESQSNG